VKKKALQYRNLNGGFTVLLRHGFSYVILGHLEEWACPPYYFKTALITAN
jgi:hypothetical protein